MLINENLNEYKFSLRECVSAGEPLNAEVIKIWKDGTGLEIRDGYGQTESTCMICNLPGSKVRFGSMGKPTFFYDMLIADADGNELAVHETGQIAVRMHPEKFRGIFKSYIGDEEKLKQVFRHGLYYTGDKAYKDEDGYYWFVGRDDDVIKSSDRVGRSLGIGSCWQSASDQRTGSKSICCTGSWCCCNQRTLSQNLSLL